MNTKLKYSYATYLPIVAAFFFLVSFAQGAPPILPHLFFGTITINETNAPAGTVLDAMVGGARKGTITISPVGKYGGPGSLEPKLLVQGNIPNNSIIRFSVNEKDAQETALFKSGKIEELNLTFLIPPPQSQQPPPVNQEKNPPPISNDQPSNTLAPSPDDRAPTTNAPPSTEEPSPSIPPLLGLTPTPPSPAPIVVSPLITTPTPSQQPNIQLIPVVGITPETAVQQIPSSIRRSLRQLLPIAGIFGENNEESFTNQIPIESEESQLSATESDKESSANQDRPNLMAAIGNILTLGTDNATVGILILLLILGALGYGFYSRGVGKN